MCPHQAYSGAMASQIVIETKAQYVSERSDPRQNMFLFSYRVKIANRGDKPARLVRRHWVITDGQGRVEEVTGKGVVGETPMIPPGATFEYSSFCPLSTPTGVMEGEYQMVGDDGVRFDAPIPPIHLIQPGVPLH